jgi:ubiquinone/menaquinone biosynthesis C-methylase UbiE
MTTDGGYVRFNREQWDLSSNDYQSQHAADLSGDRARAWGTWRIPESELNVLGNLAGRVVLEVGCGGAQWSVALAGQGANAVGLDVSERQLEFAKRLVHEQAVDVPLVQASADAIPFVGGTFDIVFCDFGAVTFVDPYAAVPEVARVLRRGGLFAFLTTSPLFTIAWREEEERPTTTLQRDYFGMHRIEWPDGVEFQLPHGEWIRVFRNNGFVVEDLIEIRPPEDATTTYEGRPLAWARRWPAEDLWRLRKL